MLDSMVTCVHWKGVFTSMVFGASMSCLNIVRNNWMVGHMVWMNIVSCVNDDVLVLMRVRMVSCSNMMWCRVMDSCLMVERQVMSRWSVMDWLVVMSIMNYSMVSYGFVMWLCWLLIMVSHYMVWSWRRVMVNESVTLWKLMSSLWMDNMCGNIMTMVERSFMVSCVMYWDIMRGHMVCGMMGVWVMIIMMNWVNHSSVLNWVMES